MEKNKFDLDIIVPVRNEEGSINELYTRIDNACKMAGICYNLVFVDDYSTDSTQARIRNLIKPALTSAENVIFEANPVSDNGSEVNLYQKRGKVGKAYSILEGVKHARSNYICMIDGDLQYPPEAIPELFRLAKHNGVAVAERNVHKTSLVRKLSSRINHLVFEKMLLGLKCDTQSGLKVFKKEIVFDMNPSDVSGWNIDMPLLVRAVDMGYKIARYNIVFDQRQSGESKVKFFDTTYEIVTTALKLKFRKKAGIRKIASTNGTAEGSGVVHKGRRFTTHTDLPDGSSALVTFYPWQKFIFVTLIAAFILSIIFNPIQTGVVFLAILTLIYFADLLFSGKLIVNSLTRSSEVEITQEELSAIDDKNLPVYTILCPLYKEANVLSAFVKAIEKIDWPKERLDVQLLLEEDDIITIKKAHELGLPKYFSIVVVPNSMPKTKPKACNYGFARAKGQYVVIYDAEDRPDPLQLKKAYLAFNKLSPNTVCLQSKLNYYNTQYNLLTKLFTAEYSLWFDLILPGLQSINTTIPLGGTSNHFKATALRYLKAWDPFNVTEDCDLGARLFREGFKTAIINSTTYEEANSRVRSWIRQRSRWIKGYLQTYLVQMRDPIGFFKRKGIHAFIFQLIIGMRMVFILINPFLWMMTILYFAFREQTAPIIEALYPASVYYLAVFTLVVGNFIYFYNYMIALAKRDQWDLMRYVFFIPFYWLMTGLAAAVAFYQLIVKPHYWEKTQHGLHLSRSKRKLGDVDIRVSIDTHVPTKPFWMPGEIWGFFERIARETIDIFKPLTIKNGVGSNKLRVLVFNWRDVKHVKSGGSETYIHEIAKRWVEQGHSVTMFSGWDGRSSRTEIVDGVQLIRRGGFFTLYPISLIYWFLKLRGKFDVIVDCENGIPFFTPFYTSTPKVLLIHHVHQEVHREQLKFPLSHIAMFMESTVMPYLYRNTQIVTVSESSRNDIISRGWTTADNISVINPGVNLTEFIQTVKTTQPSFVYFGRLRAYKNIDLAIQAFAKIVAKYPTATLSIGGDGEAMESLVALSDMLGLGDSITFYGKVDKQVRAKLLAESWAAVYPSSYEGWGITVIEANASRTPVIASDVKGLRDSVSDKNTGFLFVNHDLEDLVEKMSLIVENGVLREKLSDNALVWSANFSWDIAARKFENVLENITQVGGGYIGAYEVEEAKIL